MSEYVFGPVPSRRLGRSLGVDLVPFKTCTYDCIYCQLGRTSHKTLERREWVPLDVVLDQIEGKLVSAPDYITLSGSGEPTLFSRTGELIDRIKTRTNIPVAVLTNGSLLWQEEVRAQLMNADLIVPSLDAGDERMHRVVNRPHALLSFDKLLDGLIKLRQEFQGQYWLEVFLLDGITAVELEVRKVVECVKLIKPDRVQLNTVCRPPAESDAVGVSRERMLEFASLFDPTGEVISHFVDIHGEPGLSAGLADVLNTLRRRPCSLDDIAGGLGIHRAEAMKYLERLSAEGMVERIWIEGRRYFRVMRG